MHDKASEKHLSESDNVGLAHELCTFKIMIEVTSYCFNFPRESKIYVIYINRGKRKEDMQTPNLSYSGV